MKFKITKQNLSLTNQKKSNQIYFQIDYERKYLLHSLFKLKFEAGFITTLHLEVKEKKIKHFVCAGLFFDVTILNIRIGIYLTPIIYSTK